jgi:pimeloyl-ACP methyl ester carboxylesterase
MLDRSPEELEAWIAAGLAELRDQGRPYLVVAGAELEPDYRSWLAQQLPQATVTVLAGSGHFPHLAHPGLFAECLAAFTRWSARSYA